MDQTLEALIAKYRTMALRYVERRPYSLHPHEDVVEGVVLGLAMNRLEHGAAYCP